MSGDRSGTGPGAVAPLVDLHGLWAGIRWRRGLWVGMAVAGVLLGVGAAVLLPRPVTAATRVYVVHPDQNASGAEQMKTAVEVLRTSTVAADALRRLGSSEPVKDFLAGYTAESAAANTLDITAEGATSDEAVARAQAIADAFIADHVERSDTGTKALAVAIGARQDLLRSQLAQLAGTPDNAQSESIRNFVEGQIGTLEQQRQEAAIGSPQVAAGTRIIDAPHTTSSSFPVRIAINAALGLLLGLGGGLVLAGVASVVGDRPVLRRDVAAHLGASVIGQIPGRRRFPIRRSRRVERERESTVGSLARLVGSAPDAVSMLAIGCAHEAAQLAVDVASQMATAGPVVLVVDVPELPEVAPAAADVEVLYGTAFPSADGPGDRRVLAVASVGPTTAWMDVPRLGRETLLVVHAGRADTTWLHTVARQLADVDVVVLGVVLVHPDPRDRSDGTLWDGLHVALRGRTTGPGRSAVPTPGPVPAGPSRTAPATPGSRGGWSELGPDTDEPVLVGAATAVARNGSAARPATPSVDDDRPPDATNGRQGRTRPPLRGLRPTESGEPDPRPADERNEP